MTLERFTIKIAVHLILIKDTKTLMARRFNTGWGDGQYSLLAGHLDPHESIIEATIREAYEEGGVIVAPEDMTLVHTMHNRSDDEYINLFFATHKWENEPSITEPDKCDDMRWFPLDNLPENIIPYVKVAFQYYQNRIAFSEIHPKRVQQ